MCSGASCLDFVKLTHKCLDYALGQHIHQVSASFFKLMGIFSPLDLLCRTHPEGDTGQTSAQKVFDKNDEVQVCFDSLFQGLCDFLDIYGGNE